MPKSALMIEKEAIGLMLDEDSILHAADLKIGLYTVAPDSPEPVLVSEFGVAVPPNYAAQSVGALTGPALRLDGRRTITIAGNEFVGDADQLPITFLGWFLFNTTVPTKVLAWAPFDQPVVFLNVENMMQLTIRVSVSNPDEDVETIVVNG